MKKTTPQLLTEFLEGLNEMSGAAGVMIHHHQDLRWEFIRKIIEETKDATMKFAVNQITAPTLTDKMGRKFAINNAGSKPRIIMP